MGAFRRFYAGWLLQGIDVVDRLALWPPVSAPDDPVAFARELYHRYLAHLLAARLWLYEWIALLGAALLALVLYGMFGTAPPWVGVVLVLVGVGSAVTVGTRAAVRFLLAPQRIRPEIEAATALVRRICLRDVPQDAPPDLATPGAIVG